MTETSIRDEIEYIRKCAFSGDSRTVTLGSIVFFSTETGDAWMLDAEDNLAACLMKNEEPREAPVEETRTTLSIAWNGGYLLQRSMLTLHDDRRHATIYSDGTLVQAVTAAVKLAGIGLRRTQ
jgi:hypothetical protein